MAFKNDILPKNPPYKWVHKDCLQRTEVYNKFINWVIGEFDLYIKNESNELKVYFPNGWFDIRSIDAINEHVHIEIKVEGKSKKTCKNIIRQLQNIYEHVLHFYECRNNLVNDCNSR